MQKKLTLDAIGRFVEASQEVRCESENRQLYGWSSACWFSRSTASGARLRRSTEEQPQYAYYLGHAPAGKTMCCHYRKRGPYSTLTTPVDTQLES
jgi:hypothetical protein